MSDPVDEVNPTVNNRAAERLNRIFASLELEAQVANSLTQSLAVETDAGTKRVVFYTRDTAFRNFGVNLELILRELPQFRKILKSILFAEGDVMDHINDVPLLLEDSPSEPELSPDQLLQDYISS